MFFTVLQTYGCYMLSLPLIVVLMAVWTTKMMFPLLLILPNLESQLCWMEADVTLLANPIPPPPTPTQMPSNSEWEVTVVLKCPLLNQNFVLNFDKVTLQGSFP